VTLAREVEGEVVSADSRQVYCRMDIGTAKPTPAQRAAVPHHLVDAVEPDEDFSLAEYCERARAALAEVAGRGRVPLLVGGTGQYLAAILEGWRVPRVPPQPELRARLREEACVHGPAVLHQRLQAVDPEAAARILPGNVRRVIRALEVYEFTGEPFSRQRRREQPPYTFLVIGLTMERPALYRRVDERADEMVRQGLVDEVRNLLAAGYGWDLPAMSSLGYIQFRAYLAGEVSLEEAVARLKYDTHAFIRHQYTWFRRFPVERWVDAGNEIECQGVSPMVREWLEEHVAG
jgi:tRNA dimethylallyltransferase